MKSRLSKLVSVLVLTVLLFGVMAIPKGNKEQTSVSEIQICGDDDLIIRIEPRSINEGEF